MGAERSYNWNCIFYPDTIPFSNIEELHNVLQSNGFIYVCSPLHNLDVDVNGELVKPHYHLMICFSSLKTYKQVISDFENPFLNSSVCSKTIDKLGTIDYMTHNTENSRNKVQYDKSLIVYNKCCYDDFIKISSSQKLHNFSDILCLINENHITEYSELLDYLVTIGDTASIEVCAKSYSFAICNYLKSYHFRSNGKDFNS